VNGRTRVLERLTRVTPLGLRFWDEAAGTFVSDDLAVELFAADRPARRVTARANRSGTFYAADLPGGLDPEIAFGSGDESYWRAVAARPYVAEVADRRGRFQPFTIDLSLPSQGLAIPCAPTGSPPSMFVPLFSTPSRRPPGGIAVIRAELRHPVTANGRTSLEPAAWAVLEARFPGMTAARGLADREGRVVVLVPYPEPAARPARPASPPFPGGLALVDQEWNVALTAYFEASTPVPEIPDLCRTLGQAPALVWADAGRQQPLPEQVLHYGRELVVRSDADQPQSALVITPSG
jgi:hypothetical protein